MVQDQASVQQRTIYYNHATRVIVTVLSVIFAISGFCHGLFEALQGNTPTNGLFIHAIGENQRMWAYGNEPAFTVIPNFLVTGIASMLVSITIILWAVGFMHKEFGALVNLLLFILLFLVGGGIGQIIFFTLNWAVSTRIHKPLGLSKKLLVNGFRRILAKLWRPLLALSSALILFALELAVAGFIPGVADPEAITNVMLGSLGSGLIFLAAAYVSGFAYDIQTREGV